MGICSELFLKVVNMSITGSFVILAVLALRALLCRAPKRFSYMLWGMVLFRLLCPVTLSSEISLLDLSGGAVTENGEMAYLSGTFAQGENAAQTQSTQAKSGENAAQNQFIQAKSDEKFARSAAEGIENAAAENLGGESAKRREDISKFGSLIWMMGVGTFLCFGAASAIRLQLLVSCSLQLRDNVYLADGIASPFVLGLLHPRIYLPSSIEEEELSYVILHEQSHIARKDYLVKILAFLALSLHWFNPLAWLAFALSGKDMEMSCDEAVMRKIDSDVRAEYAMSLLHFTLGKRMGGMPLGFGAGDVKSRIKNVMNYKKPAGAAIVLGALACLLGGACLLTNPKSEKTEPAKKGETASDWKETEQKDGTKETDTQDKVNEVNETITLEEKAIQKAMIETDIKIGLPIALPENDVSMQECQVKKNEENYLEIQYYDGILDGYCTLWAVKDGSLDLPEASYEKELEETWEGHTLAERRVEVKVQHAPKQVLAVWEYENYKFAIIGKAVPGEDGTDSVPKTALGIIMQLP